MPPPAVHPDDNKKDDQVATVSMAELLGVLAWHFKWFPPVYVLVVFIIIPLFTLGMSQLFISGPAAVVFAGISCAIVAAATGYGSLQICRSDYLQRLKLEADGDAIEIELRPEHNHDGH